MSEQHQYGPAAACRSLVELTLLLHRIVGDEARKAVVAYGMIIAARSAPDGKYYADALEVLNCLGAAKAELDKAVCHGKSVVSVTASILAVAQDFVDETTIPCTEWPHAAEVVTNVCKSAARYAFTGPWKRTVLGERGEIIGVEEFASDSLTTQQDGHDS